MARGGRGHGLEAKTGHGAVGVTLKVPVVLAKGEGAQVGTLVGHGPGGGAGQTEPGGRSTQGGPG